MKKSRYPQSFFCLLVYYSNSHLLFIIFFFQANIFFSFVNSYIISCTPSGIKSSPFRIRNRTFFIFLLYSVCISSSMSLIPDTKSTKNPPELLPKQFLQGILAIQSKMVSHTPQVRLLPHMQPQCSRF